MLWLSDDDVRRHMPDREDVIALVGPTLHGLETGRVLMPPRSVMSPGEGARFITFPAAFPDLGIAGVKWFGIHHPPDVGRKSSSAQIILSRIEGAATLAVLDAAWITAVRTALVSLYAARLLARPDAHHIAFVACGEQAELHLSYFRACFPIRQVSTYSRRLTTAESFAARAREHGLGANAFADIAAAVKEADIIIASSPAKTRELIRPHDLRAGSFLSLVDLGRSLDLTLMPRDGTLFVDDPGQAEALRSHGDIPLPDHLTLRPLSAPPVEQHFSPFLPTGLGALDIALAYRIFQAAAKTPPVHGH